MFVDVAIPSKNEMEFIAVAEKLDTKALLFLYPGTKAPKLELVKGFKVFTGCIVKDARDIGRAKKNFDLVFAEGDRQYFENKNVDAIIDLETSPKSDGMHQRYSGLNPVLCNLARKNKIGLCFSFNNLLKAVEQDVVLGRMMQNVRLCRKYKNQSVIASFARDPCELRYSKDLISFGIVAGMHPEEAKSAVEFLGKLLK